MSDFLIELGFLVEKTVDITIEQAKAFESVARLGTIQKAAAELNKGTSAVLYSLQVLEHQTQVQLFDRSGYRNQITREGEVVLKLCRKLLDVKNEILETCVRFKDGWEPSLKLIYDEVVDFNLLGQALFQLNEMKPPTEVKVLSAHLDRVGETFLFEKADMMVTILPFQELQIPSHSLKPIRMCLVAHQGHDLSKKTKGQLTSKDLNRHTFITIKTTAGAVGLSTEKMNFDSYFIVNGFMTKKMAIMNRLGFGWLPDYLIEKEIKKGSLQILKTEIDSNVVVYPKLYHRNEEQLGKASLQLLSFLRQKN